MSNLARKEILELLRKRLGTDIGYDDFRLAFEELFNFRLHREDFSDREFEILQRLFEVVVWYSPLPGDRAEVPHYKTEQEVNAVVEEARRLFGICPHGKN